LQYFAIVSLLLATPLRKLAKTLQYFAIVSLLLARPLREFAKTLQWSLSCSVFAANQRNPMLQKFQAR
jgi:hypothetical protein